MRNQSLHGSDISIVDHWLKKVFFVFCFFRGMGDTMVAYLVCEKCTILQINSTQ